jgi:hypothetical protein
MTGLGAIAVVGAASVFRWGSARERHLSASLFAGILLLAFFGVAVDFAHSLVLLHWLEPTVAIAEDAGELIVISGLLSTVWGINRRGGTQHPASTRADAEVVVG